MLINISRTQCKTFYEISQLSYIAIYRLQPGKIKKNDQLGCQEWIEKNPFNNYKLKYKHKERDFLNGEELFMLEKADLGTKILRHVKDLFVFSCYTGLAYIDLINLAPNQIVAESNNTKWIRTSRAKNDIGVNVPLLKPAIDIMEKFKSENDVAIRETISPGSATRK